MSKYLKLPSKCIRLIIVSSLALVFYLYIGLKIRTSYPLKIKPVHFEVYLGQGNPIILNLALLDYFNQVFENASTKIPNSISNHQTCNIPKLTLGNKDVYNLDYEQFRRYSQDHNVSLSCINNNSTVFSIDFEANLVRSQSLAILLNDASCYYKPFWKDTQKPDFHYIFDTEVYLIPPNTDKMKLPSRVEHIYIWCNKSNSSPNSSYIYEDIVSHVPVKPDLEKKLINLPASRNPDNYPSVIIFGQDSSSHMNFLRYVPKVHDFLVNEMDAIEFNGFNSLGDGTRYSMFPFFSGMDFYELNNLFQRKFTDLFYYPDIPLIWREFQKLGYRTSWAEDRPQDGIFNSGIYPGLYRYPVDYDFRAFTRLLETLSIRRYNKSVDNDYGCYGPRLTFDVLLENLVKTAFTFSRVNKPVWYFSWTSELTHEVNLMSKYQEPSFLEALRKMHSHKVLNNTVLIVMSDHGMRHGPLRQRTRQGFLEERLAILYIVLPKRFKQRFPNAYSNMRENANKLTTAFDLYATMKDLMHLETLETGTTTESRNRTGRSISLFRQISENRNCDSIGIPPIYCSCIRRENISTDRPFIKKVAGYIVKAMNIKLEEYPQCDRLKLESVTNAIQLGSAADSVLYEIGLETSPGSGTFYASVFEDTINKAIKVTDITRTSKYGRDADCMQDQWLKPFCHCKK